jgi:uncharacterized protein
MMVMDKDKDLVLKQTEEFVRRTLESESSGHDWWHIYRVWRSATHIAKCEYVDLFVVQLAALLHDLDDYKLQLNTKSDGATIAQGWLRQLEVDEKVNAHVCEIIQGMCFKGAGVITKMRTKEGMVVQDADRLDAIGAIGIARTFAYGGSRDREIYNPDIQPEIHTSFEQYKNSTGTTINHFYEKLLLLKDLMNTETAKKIAEERHRFMEQFLNRFFREWEGEA